MKATILALGLALLLVLLPADKASACPNCKEAVASQSPEEAQRVTNGYFYSILFMMGMPFLVVGTGGFFIARAVKRGVLPEL